jgi:hypothetical protein
MDEPSKRPPKPYLHLRSVEGERLAAENERRSRLRYV